MLKSMIGAKKKRDKMSELTKRQKEALAKHSSHHTKKHINEMIKQMKKGKTFTASHKLAMKKVGN